MKEIRLRARAKINLTLDVTGKRQDGYHELAMVMQTVSLYDAVFMKQIDKPMVRVKSNLLWLPSDKRNLAYQAAMLIRKEFGIDEGVFIELQKRIPVAAGLAGGSADCAAVLVGMNRLFSLGLSTQELMELALKLGTDIPYCVLRGTALAEGIGEQLTPIFPHCPHCYVVLVKPPISVSTAFVYKHLKLSEITKHPNTQGMLDAIQKGDLHGIGNQLCNVLETVTIPLHPQIGSLKTKLLELGALGSLMSGSGPTVFGLFEDKEVAMQAATVIKKEMKYKDVFVTELFQPNEKKGGR